MRFTKLVCPIFIGGFLALACGREVYFDTLSEDSYVYNFNELARSKGFSENVKAFAKRDLSSEVEYPSKVLKELLAAFKEDRRHLNVKTLNIFLVGPRGLDTLQYPQVLAEKVVQDTADLPSELKGRTILEIELTEIAREAQKLKMEHDAFLEFLLEHIHELKIAHRNPLFVFSQLESLSFSSREGTLPLQTFLRHMIDWDCDTLFLVTPEEYRLHIAGRVIEAESKVIRVR
ncbi:MAG: hypothetical protein HYW48_05190 [Deltaproteobacteria bacterium]|nr:hypothetical protein [Deltaproteobacteria bacterium]